MAFEILSSSGEKRLLQAVDPVSRPQAPSYFVDSKGHRYSAYFDGKNVVFNDGTANFIGRWVLGSSATVIRDSKQLADGFTFTFMDHGPGPQRLHAVWVFEGSVEKAVTAWKAAGFRLSDADRNWNRNHPASLHLRTKGAFGTGANSSHAIIPVVQTREVTHGEMHVGEFNPLTGCGVGFVLHQLEDLMWKLGLQREDFR